ncbi:MAG: D-glycero-beta-D-manno-heptose 1-phosphate adenylyltransferase [Selenomonadaceae bacterium]|nr:D-glycero-beta-D-manno-heptose 1-phosphate adenylyltransferase [Selenomonadaceae bacterium]
MLIDRKNLFEFCEKIRIKGEKIIFTNGCFDIIHAGHVRYLTAAKNFGGILIVGLNSDESVRKLKGETRPINNEQDRAEVLLGLKAVDHVVLFEENTAENLISEIRPNIYVKGGDYNLENLPEAKIVQSYGGEVKFINLVEGRSTSNIIKKINSTPPAE